ncbi:MAG: TauD/TfdA family dioxygenase [Alphaproteobacteria bacterium]|jgi:taurine dioxygenase|nr:TauD/TfdA family dioxygenase [Rhodospirillaceae bacterium]MDG2479285.1 TauD/TfdA family dioxygenase [Alphaproteobacteria bacterium]MBT6205353.1 TauD/TfdA family dioxygenase [Rhodospirillaceae bacterium]MBT6512053.1 TauD/TfdA family dioxygenase [Rhodospirillaceae bacterium]MBT7611860.1 TauD/TfdA family dioxygenase [Rhodospirillaceae bacterium]
MPDRTQTRPLPALDHPLASDMQDAVLHRPQFEPRNYQYITVEPISGALGAEVAGIDLAAIDDATMAEVEQAMLDHLVLVFRDQNLEPADQLGFARRLGQVAPWPYAKPMEGYPELTELVSGPGDINNFGGSWHTDSSTFEAPPAYTVLYCVSCPPVGGDTSYANQYLAWDTLPEDVKTGIEGRRLEHSTARAFGDHATGKGSPDATTTPVSVPTQHLNLVSMHPIVRTHPKTGKKALYVNTGFAFNFEGCSDETSKPLMDALATHGSLPEFTCRVRWRPGTLVVWDNRCCLHYAHNDYRGQPRTMRRAVVAGERPV